MGNIAMCQHQQDQEKPEENQSLNQQSNAPVENPDPDTLQPKKKVKKRNPAKETFLQPFEEQFEKDSKVSIDNFKLVKVLGKGSFGKVMLVEHKETQQMYAMKVLLKKSIKTERQKRHTLTERFVLENMKHPFIIQLNFAFQTDEKLYLVLDYMNGGELFQHLQKQGRFKEEVARFYAAEILLAIEHLHKNNIFYRDLKPENVLMGEDGHIKIADFGLSFKSDDEAAYAKSMCGTPEYLAPEILLSKRGHDKTVDWWSLGSLIYEMLTGLPPFYSEDKKKMFQNVISKKVPMPAFLSEQAVSLLKKLLVVDPSKRLGYGPRDADDIKEHKFFQEIDWEKLKNKQMEPPLKFKLQGPEDLKYFDRHIVKQDAKDTPVQPGIPTGIAFSNFTYVAQGNMQQKENQSNETMEGNSNGQKAEFKIEGIEGLEEDLQ